MEYVDHPKFAASDCGHRIFGALEALKAVPRRSSPEVQAYAVALRLQLEAAQATALRLSDEVEKVSGLFEGLSREDVTNLYGVGVS